VPVDGFWSVSVYDAEGYFQPNQYNAYSLNNITATKGADGSFTIQFGGCDGKIANCLPIVPRWAAGPRRATRSPASSAAAPLPPTATPPCSQFLQ
jgi:hypothetical protein